MEGKLRVAAMRPLVMALALAPFAACSCDDRLIELDPGVNHAPPFPDLGDGPQPGPDPIGAIKNTLIARASGNTGCDGASLTLGLLVFGGKPPYSIRWDDSPELVGTDSHEPVATAFGDREYFVTVTDSRGDSVRTSATVTRTGLPTPSIGFVLGSDEVCAGSEVVLDASSSIAADGSPPASLTWDLDGDGTDDAMGPVTDPLVPLDGQRVRLTVTDSLGCGASRELELAVRPNPTPDVAFLAGSANVCSGDRVTLDASGSRDADGGPVTSFAWDLDGNPTTIESTDPVSPGLSPSDSLAVTLTVIDPAGCASTVTRMIEVRPLPTASIGFATGRAGVCVGEGVSLSGSASRDADGNLPTAFSWDLDGDGSVDASGAVSPLFTPAGPVTARLTVTDAQGCNGSAAQSFAILPTPIATIDVLGPATLCAGDLATFDGSRSRSGGQPVTSFAWDLDGDGTDDATGTATDPLVPLDGQRVRLTVADASGCTASRELELAVRSNPTPHVTFLAGSASVCSGNPVTLDASGSRDADGAPMTSFAWDANGDGASDRTGSSTTVNPIADGAVTLTVTDAVGCRTRFTQPLAVAPLPVAAIAVASGDDRLCLGQSVALDGLGSHTATGGTDLTYAWDLDGNPATIESTDPAPPALSPSTSGEITLTVTDSAGCSSAATKPIQVRPLPTASIGFATGRADLCVGEGVSLAGSASRDADGNPPTAFSWDLDGDGAEDASGAVSPLFTPAGSLAAHLSVTDAQGCTGSAVQSFTILPSPTATIDLLGPPLLCDGDLATLDGSRSRAGSRPVTSYAWDIDGDGTNDAMGPVTDPLVPLDGQRVRLTVTDSLGCSASRELELAVRPNPTPDIVFTAGGDQLCAGGPVALDASGSTDADGLPMADFSWDLDGDGNSDAVGDQTGTFVPANSGTATVTVTDGFGCSATRVQPLVIRGNPTPVIAFVQGDELLCHGELLALDASLSRDADGGSNLAFAWDLDGDGTGDATGPIPPPLFPDTARTVRLTVTDADGCAATATRLVHVRDLPLPDIAFTRGGAFTCAGSTVAVSGAGTLDADGNLPPLLSWDLDGNGTIDADGATPPDFTPAASATIRLSVTDSSGCTAEASRSLDVQALPMAVIDFATGAERRCLGDEVALDGGRSRDATGAPVARFAWDLDGDGSDDVTSSRAGFVPAASALVNLTVTDARGCVGTTSRPLQVQGLPTARIHFVQGSATVCDGASLELSADGSTDADGSPIASFTWDLDGNPTTVESSSAATGPFVPATSATATVRVTDSLGCSATASQELNVRATPRADAGPDLSVCAGGSIVLGGSNQPGIEYAWSPATGLDSTTTSAPLAKPDVATTYRLTVTDDFGCAATDSVQISVNPLPIVEAGPDRQVAAGGAVRLAGGASGGTPAYLYAWSPASSVDDAGSAHPLASPATSGAFTLTVTDANGCVAHDSVAVSVVGALSIGAGDDRRLCQDGGDTLTLSSIATGGVAPHTYRWSASPPCGNCIANPTSPSTAVSPKVDTVFTVVVTDVNGTTATDTVAVSVLPGLVVDAGPDRKIDRGAVTQIGTPLLPGLDTTWTCDNWSCGLSDAHVAMPFVAPEGNTAYRVTVTDGDTCTASDTVIVAMDSRVIATVPTEGYTPWPRDALIWIVFDADMDASTLNAANIHLIDPSDGSDVVLSSIAYDPATRTLTLDPIDRNYANNRPVVLVLRGGPGGIHTAGPFPTSLATDFVVEFNASSNGDGRAPNVAYAQPAALALGVATTTDVVVSFDEPVDPRSVTPTTFQVTGVPATVTYDPRTYTANLRPAMPLDPNRTYTVRLNGVKDGPGNLTNLTWTFSTGPNADGTAPLVVASIPYAGETAFDVAGTIAVTFNEPVDPATLDGFRLIDVASGFPVSGEITYDEASRTAVLDANRILDPNHAFQILVSGVADQAGNPMAGIFSASFTTQSVRWLERFESGVANWNLGAPWATHLQAARYGLLGLTDSPNGNSSANVDISAVGPGFDVSGRTDVALSFWNRRTMATTGTDAARVEYSTNNGATWSQAPSGSSLTGPIGWRLQTYTLPTNGSSQMRVRFRMQTDASVNLDGWFVDEIVVR